MDAHAKPPTINVRGDARLGEVLKALAPHGNHPLLFEYAGRMVQRGYHVTEVKAGSFVTLDCGGQPDAWQETILQVEDLPLTEGTASMTVSKFRSILGQVGERIDLKDEARLTIEVGRPGEAMRVFDVGELSVEADGAVIRLVPRAAICKPRHRAAQNTGSCCGPAVSAAKCCA